MMKKVVFLCMIALAFTACSSDEPDDNGGTGTGGTNNIGGDWVSRWYTEIEADAATKAAINKDIEGYRSDGSFPKAGYIKFLPGVKAANAPAIVEGRLSRTYDNNSSAQSFGDYYVKGDTVFYTWYSEQLMGDAYETGRWNDYYIRKGNKMYYIYDITSSCKSRYPNGNVKKAIFYTEYTKR